MKAVQYDGTEVEIAAAKGVILATGGYGANIKMVLDTNRLLELEGPQGGSIKTTNRNLSQGEGIVMGKAVGGAVTGMGLDPAHAPGLGGQRQPRRRHGRERHLREPRRQSERGQALRERGR